MESRIPLAPSRRGFTLIELLVVVAVIALLVGILLPSLAMARKQAKGVNELSASRQLMQGYTGYAMDSKDALIPGHINETYDLRDDQGRVLSPAEVVKRWPWRMVAYLGCGVRGSLLVNERAQDLADRNSMLWSYMVSLTPSFGLNYFNLGGDQTGGGANNSPGCLMRLDRAVNPVGLTVFVSARSVGEFGAVHGYFKVVAPTKAFEYSANGWTTSGFEEKGEPGAWGYVHPRWMGKAIVAALDGHSEAVALTDLRDMRRWSNEAARTGDVNWR